jgi:hypothetical protein
MGAGHNATIRLSFQGGSRRERDEQTTTSNSIAVHFVNYEFRRHLGDALFDRILVRVWEFDETMWTQVVDAHRRGLLISGHTRFLFEKRSSGHVAVAGREEARDVGD